MFHVYGSFVRVKCPKCRVLVQLYISDFIKIFRHLKNELRPLQKLDVRVEIGPFKIYFVQRYLDRCTYINKINI